MKRKEVETPVCEPDCFFKEQLAASERYRQQQDLIMALLTEGRTYTLEETDKIIQTYLKGKVN